jgi:hypothetical protein
MKTRTKRIRAFRSSFTAPAPDIEQWLQQSPGTREAQPSTPSPGIRRFEIVPGGGAQHAEVTVGDSDKASRFDLRLLELSFIAFLGAVGVHPNSSLLFIDARYKEARCLP